LRRVIGPLPPIESGAGRVSDFLAPTATHETHHETQRKQEPMHDEPPDDGEPSPQCGLIIDNDVTSACSMLPMDASHRQLEK
jgi:hypothetical protein